MSLLALFYAVGLQPVCICTHSSFEIRWRYVSQQQPCQYPHNVKSYLWWVLFLPLAAKLRQKLKILAVAWLVPLFPKTVDYGPAFIPLFLKWPISVEK